MRRSRGLTLHGPITIVRRIAARQGGGWIFRCDPPPAPRRMSIPLDAVTVVDPRSKGDVEPLVRLAKDDMAAVDALILARMQSQVPVIPLLADHLNHNGSVHIGTWWRVLISVVAPAALAYVLVDEFITDVETAYEGYPQWMLLTFGWGATAAVIVLGFLATTIPWRPGTSLDTPPSAADLADTRGDN